MTIFDYQEEIANDLRRNGYEVNYEVKGNSGVFYDMIARKDSQAIAFEIKTQSKLGLEFFDIPRLRNSARQDGYQDFRLIVMPEEKHKSIEIINLDKNLLLWLKNHPEIKKGTLLDELIVNFGRVDMVQVDNLSSHAGEPGTQVSGVAVVEFSISSDGQTAKWDCPFHFDAHLDSNWQLESVNLLHLDLGSISEYIQEYLSDTVK